MLYHGIGRHTTRNATNGAEASLNGAIIDSERPPRDREHKLRDLG